MDNYDAIIEAGVDTSVATAQPQADAAIAAQETPEIEGAEPEEQATENREDAFPKKAVNAISRRDKQIGKLRAEREQLAAELNKFRAQSTQTKPANTGAPKEAEFTNYADFLEAKNAYAIEQKFAERDTKHEETQRTTQEKAWISEREQALSVKAQQFVKEMPDAAALVEEYSDVIDEFSPQLQRLFLEADNAPLAFYNLAKEGKLESLASMSLARAAMEIGRAETQAATKPKTKAPTPLPAARGSVAPSKSLESMSGDELLKWVNS